MRLTVVGAGRGDDEVREWRRGGWWGRRRVRPSGRAQGEGGRAVERDAMRHTGIASTQGACHDAMRQRISYRLASRFDRRGSVASCFPYRDRGVMDHRRNIRECEGAVHYGAGRLRVWAQSPLSYVAAPTAHPVECEARRDRCHSALSQTRVDHSGFMSQWFIQATPALPERKTL